MSAVTKPIDPKVLASAETSIRESIAQVRRWGVVKPPSESQIKEIAELSALLSLALQPIHYKDQTAIMSGVCEQIRMSPGLISEFDYKIAKAKGEVGFISFSAPTGHNTKSRRVK